MQLFKKNFFLMMLSVGFLENQSIPLYATDLTSNDQPINNQPAWERCRAIANETPLNTSLVWIGTMPFIPNLLSPDQRNEPSEEQEIHEWQQWWEENNERRQKKAELSKTLDQNWDTCFEIAKIYTSNNDDFKFGKYLEEIPFKTYIEAICLHAFLLLIRHLSTISTKRTPKTNEEWINLFKNSIKTAIKVEDPDMRNNAYNFWIEAKNVKDKKNSHFHCDENIEKSTTEQAFDKEVENKVLEHINAIFAIASPKDSNVQDRQSIDGIIRWTRTNISDQIKNLEEFIKDQIKKITHHRCNEIKNMTIEKQIQTNKIKSEKSQNELFAKEKNLEKQNVELSNNEYTSKKENNPYNQKNLASEKMGKSSLQTAELALKTNTTLQSSQNSNVTASILNNEGQSQSVPASNGDSQRNSRSLSSKRQSSRRRSNSQERKRQSSRRRSNSQERKRPSSRRRSNSQERKRQSSRRRSNSQTNQKKRIKRQSK